MNLQQLIYFRTAARMEHMTEAAAALHISQPSLTATIRRLEEELGAELFERRGRNIRLSAFGKAFLPYAENAVSELEEGQRAVDALKEKSHSSVRLVTPPVELHPGLLERLLACCPSLVISNEKDTGDAMRRKLKDGIIDLCISANLPESRDLSWELLSEDEFVALMPAAHPLAKRESISFGDLKGVGLSTFPRHTGVYRQIEQCCVSAGYYPKVAFTAERLSDVVNSVLPCGSAAVLDAETRETFRGRIGEDLVFVPIVQPGCVLARRIYWRRGEKRAGVLSVRDEICAYFRERGSK
ncbi:MAG: LysR family transcriptional regulator [Lachnospiraceae bacterium]|nr:LysR family transcriptional regulator [Lachnospiraceae bacterium]